MRPGSGVHATVDALDAGALDTTLSAPRPHGLAQQLLAIIPDSFVSAFVSGDVLQVLFLAVLTGSALAALGERVAPLVTLLESFAAGVFAIEWEGELDMACARQALGLAPASELRSGP